MAKLRKRNDKWHVQIRRKDYPSQTNVLSQRRQWKNGLERQRSILILMLV